MRVEKTLRKHLAMPHGLKCSIGHRRQSGYAMEQLEVHYQPCQTSASTWIVLSTLPLSLRGGHSSGRCFSLLIPDGAKAAKVGIAGAGREPIRRRCNQSGGHPSSDAPSALGPLG